jgi:glutamate-1-semialdehyde 2,1-aminomutase
LPAETRVPQSLNLYDKAKQRIAGRTHLFGRRAELQAYGFSPLYSDRQSGGHFGDVDGHDYIDYNMGTGAVLLGHAYPSVVRAVQEQAARGTGLSVNHPLEIEAAELMASIVPCCEMMRFCKGGGEANAIAVRIARAATRREKVLFCGYHGWHDWYLAANLESSTNLERYLLPGIEPLGVADRLRGSAFPFVYNDLASLRTALETHSGEVACVILEPARSFLPAPGFLEGVLDLAHQHGAIVIFDEVVTGFRVAVGGAQQHYNVKPDMATFAKAISNGFALGAICGRREIMEVALDSFISSVYWAEATGLAACRAALGEYQNGCVCRQVWHYGGSFIEGIRKAINESGLPAETVGLPPYPTLVFRISPEQAAPLSTLYMQETARRGLFGGLGFYFCYQHTEEDLISSLSILTETFDILSRALREGAIEKYLESPVRQQGFRRLV